MSFDNSRFTFNPWNDYSGVVMEQGRVQLDSDWNEWLAELFRRFQAGTFDAMGHAAYPATTPFAFQITASSSGGANSLTIGTGRMYIDGLLAENHGLLANAQWDSALAELSGSPQPPPAASVNPVDFFSQPHYTPANNSLAGDGPFLAYLDVWTRPVTYLEDPELIDKAVGVDTTGRLQTVWQVKLMAVPSGGNWNCATPDSSIPWPVSSGQLTNGTIASGPSGPCCLTNGTGYTGAENQFYRVEIHQAGGTNALGATGGATFKWSRDNASVETGVTSIANATNTVGDPATRLSVLSLGRDQVLGFIPGNWIEVLDESLYLSGQPGELRQIDSVDVSARTITLTAPLTAANFPVGTPAENTRTRIRRWDHSGKIYEQDGTTVWYDLGAAGSKGDIPVPVAGTTLILESGITVTFNLSSAAGTFQTGDFWTFAARTADGSLDPQLTNAPPRGIHHHYTKLSIVNFNPSSATDCRNPVPTGGGKEDTCGCCTCTVGDGVESHGQFTSIQKAIESLPDAGGEVCILPGRYFEHVLIERRRDIVVQGCGWQTRLASPSLGPAANDSSSSSQSNNTFNAVITVVDSEHVILRSFAVEADTGEVGILLDGTGNLNAAEKATTRVSSSMDSQNPNANQATGEAAATDRNTFVAKAFSLRSGRVIDATLEDLVLTASTLPAILASTVTLLNIRNNRIAMKNVRSLWPAVYVSGQEIRIRHNWVGIQSATADVEWLPTSVLADIRSDGEKSSVNSNIKDEILHVGVSPAATSTTVSLHPGGIQIAGPSQDVFVIENEIEGGRRNGITLGSFSLLDENGSDTGITTGVFIVHEGDCSTSTSFEPGTPGQGSGGSSVAAGGKLINIQINRNRIRNMGLCGIGPVGFFNLRKTVEVISIKNLTITANTISSTLLIPTSPNAVDSSSFGYGAICVPDVENLIVRDNTITDFGVRPGVDVCGIFVLNGQMVEISRNHIVETRDLVSGTWVRSADAAGGLRAGIFVMLVTPPALEVASSSLWDSSVSQMMYESKAAEMQNYALAAPLYAPGLPALRVEHNVVRMALGEALEVVGFGPFSIVNNNFSTGGTVSAVDASKMENMVASSDVQLTTTPNAAGVLTVMIMNLGTSMDVPNAGWSYSSLYGTARDFNLDIKDASISTPTNGAVLFTNNVCQFQGRASRERGSVSVAIFSLDDLIFSNNHCRLEGREGTATLDAALLAASIQVCGNRFQESLNSVAASGSTYGLLNITSQNISTYCLFASGPAAKLIQNNNVVLHNQLCSKQ